jgi:hypothetical protein
MMLTLVSPQYDVWVRDVMDYKLDTNRTTEIVK